MNTRVSLIACLLILSVDGISQFVYKNVGTSGLGAVSAISFVSPDSGYVASFDGKIYKTTDGGNTWQRRYLNNPGEPAGELLDVSFLDPYNGVISTGQGMVYMTNNGGGS